MNEELKKKLSQIPPNVLEEIEDEYLYKLAAERMKNFDINKCIPGEEVFRKAGITDEDLANVDDIEIE